MKRTKIIFILTALVLSIVCLKVPTAFAQEPTTWQQSATGLNVNQNADKKTSGLGFVVQAQSWPFISARGAVEANGDGTLRTDQRGIELGFIKVPGGSSVSLSSQTVDWAHNELTFTYNTSSQLKLWVSRLSPAVLVQSSASSLRMLAGNVSGNIFNGTTVSSRGASPSYPKYVAYSSGGNIQIRTLSTSALSLSSMDQNWVLVWYGSSSHFVETKKPLSYSGPYSPSLPQRYAYQADVPILIIFQNRPASIQHSSEGGVEVSFSGSSGYVSLLPLFGRDHLRNSETENWSQGLPASVNQKIQFWSSHLCSFPANVSETYSYNQATDTTTIRETITYVTACSGGTVFAPIPPMLALAKDALGVTFSGAVVDGSLNTEFGPTLGIENTQEYTWSVTGLKKYTDAKRIITGGDQAPTDLEQELTAEVNKIISAGHFAPWIFIDSIPVHFERGDLYWANPADIIYHLSEVATVLSGTVQSNLTNYIKSEKASYPPEDVYDLPLQTGTIRKNYSSYSGDWDYCWNVYRTDAHQHRVPLYSFFALSRYYELTNEAIPSQVLQKAKDALSRDMSEQDWATSYWFKGYDDRVIAVVNANRHFAGLVGFVRLARTAQDTQAENLGRALLAKAAVLRLGVARYPRYLYSANLIELPTESDWQPRYAAGGWLGLLPNYNWTVAYDDARQVSMLDQFGIYLQDHSGFIDLFFTDVDLRVGQGDVMFPYLTAFRDMVPELARFLADYARQDVEIYVNKVEALFPHWYAAFAEGMLGSEHNLSHPIDSFQIFMAKAFIKNETAQNLERFADNSWLESGDLFYVQKLAEVVKAYKGWSWSDVPLPSVSPTPAHCSPLGDIDCSTRVNVLDLSALLGAFGSTTNSAADLDDSGRVNVLDLSILLGNFGK